MTPKILALVDSCKKCPNRRPYSGNTHECLLVDQKIADDSAIAPFCPLVDFPAQKLADLDNTVRLLREPNKYGLVLAVMSHAATKLKTTVTDRHAIKIMLKDGTSVMLFPDHILSIDPMQAGEIEFMFDRRKFRLCPDGREPTLQEEGTIPGTTEPVWTNRKLA